MICGNRFIVFVLLLGAAATAGALTEYRGRRPVGPGVWYPASAEELREAVRGYMAEDPDEPSRKPEGRLRALVTPHSGYDYAGSVMGAAFRHVERGAYDRVIVLSPSHRAHFQGCSIPSVHYYLTPLGPVFLDGTAIYRVLWSPHISRRALTYPPSGASRPLSGDGRRKHIHENEHGIEVVLPFLQERLDEFRIIPVVVGDLRGEDGRVDQRKARAIASALEPQLTERTLLVASVEFTHYGEAFGFERFGAEPFEAIQDLDIAALRLVLQRNRSGFARFVHENGPSFCGSSVLFVLMELVPPSARGILFDYTMSGLQTGDAGHSVSYAAAGFFEPRQAQEE
ncbi:MAG: AmmeMemoRadiSam system protein B [Candidatus Hydrogenedentota bacterium]